MKIKLLLILGVFGFANINAQLPEVLYYNFNGAGTSVPNLASAPPAGTEIHI